MVIWIYHGNMYNIIVQLCTTLYTCQGCQGMLLSHALPCEVDTSKQPQLLASKISKISTSWRISTSTTFQFSWNPPIEIFGGFKNFLWSCQRVHIQVPTLPTRISSRSALSICRYLRFLFSPFSRCQCQEPKNHVKWSQWMFMNMATMDYGPEDIHFLTRYN